jgi:hypothetical protein
VPVAFSTTPPGNAVDPNRYQVAVDELARYTKIVRRLKWKLPYLASGYRQAINRVGPDVDPAQVAEAELMFKLDFYEYYMLLERALVHLLGVFGVTVSREFALRHLRALTEEQERESKLRNGSNGSPYSNTIANDNGTATPKFSHRYHANVLEALDHVDSPLHEVLGTGDVRQQLGRAKDLRNRWKNADDGGDAAKGNGKIAAPLESYNVERMLATIFEGFDRAYMIAERFVLEQRQAGDFQMDGSGKQNIAAYEEQQWEFMVDAMDWEAV